MEQDVANHKSAAKRAGQTEKRTLRNKAVRTRVRHAVRRLREAIAGGLAPEDVRAAWQRAVKTIDKAASKGVLHRRAASRRISRISKLVHRQVTSSRA